MGRHLVSALAALAATSLAPRVVRAQAEAFTWHAPAGTCPTEATVREWLAREVAAGGGEHTTRVVVTVWHGESGWRAVIRRRRGAGIATSEVAADDCGALAHLAVQEVVFDTAVLPDEPPRPVVAPVAFVTVPPPEVVPAPPPSPPSRPSFVVLPPGAPPEARPRVWFDVGLGAGLGTVHESSAYAEGDPAAGGRLCAYGACRWSSGLAPSTFVHLGVRVRLSARVALGVQARVQLDAAPWSVAWERSDANGRAWGTRPNDLANLLVGARVYYALSPRGFAARGPTWSVFAGGGVGQIEPVVDTWSDGTTTHVRSGYGNVNAGLRFDHAVSGAVHLGAELTTHLMFPQTLFDVDLTVTAGMHL